MPVIKISTVLDSSYGEPFNIIGHRYTFDTFIKEVKNFTKR